MRKTSKPAVPRPHPTRRLAVKTAAIDALMAPLVDWLNGFEETTTLHCCQGEPGPEPDFMERPYISFTCTNPLELMTILETFRYAARVDVSYDREYPTLRYRAEFGSQEAVKTLVLKR